MPDGRQATSHHYTLGSKSLPSKPCVSGKCAGRRRSKNPVSCGSVTDSTFGPDFNLLPLKNAPVVLTQAY